MLGLFGRCDLFSIGLALFMDREVDREARPLALAAFGLRVGKNIAARLFDDAINRRQAESGPLAHRLGRKERFENLA